MDATGEGGTSRRLGTGARPPGCRRRASRSRYLRLAIGSGGRSGAVAWWDLGSGRGGSEARVARTRRRKWKGEAGRDPIRAFVPATAPRPRCGSRRFYFWACGSRLVASCPPVFRVPSSTLMSPTFRCMSSVSSGFRECLVGARQMQHPSGVLLTKRMQNGTCSAPLRLCKLQLRVHRRHRRTACSAT